MFKDVSAEVQKIWDEAHKVIEEPEETKEEEGPEEESNQDTLGSTEAPNSGCCGMEYSKVHIMYVNNNHLKNYDLF